MKIKEYVFEYPHSKENLISRISEYNLHHDTIIGQIKILDENCFSLCLHGHSHTPSTWYIARIEEKQNALIIRGQIIEQKRKPHPIVFLGYIFLWPILIIQKRKHSNICKNMRAHTADTQVQMLHTLNQVMLDHLGCKQTY